MSTVVAMNEETRRMEQFNDIVANVKPLEKHLSRVIIGDSAAVSLDKLLNKYVMEQCRESEKVVRDIIRIPLEKYLLYDGKTLRRSEVYCIIMPKIV